ncbi:MAG: hypothetical protein WCP90_04340, partial [Opitutae bacterium]
DVIYELASAFEKMGRTKEAMEEFKAIYMADSGYRDVSKKINAFYESQKGPASLFWFGFFAKEENTSVSSFLHPCL